MKHVLQLGLALLLTASCPAENWPCFRGPSRQGISTAAQLPLRWSATDGVAWKTPLPGAGWSSPIVWGDRIFITTATDGGTSCHLLCLNAATGAVLWDVEVFQQEVLRKEARNSYATSTPVTDGRLVYTVFGAGGLAAVDFTGKVIWTFKEWTFYSRHGLGASPVLHEGLLMLPWDWSQNPQDGEEKVGWQIPWEKSFVFALDAATGKLRWKTMRGRSRIAHVTPNIYTDSAGKPQLVSGAGDVVQGFELASGKILWSGRNDGEGVVPSIVIAGDLALAPNGFGGFDSVRAFKVAGAQGDISETGLAWEQKKNASKIPSLIYVEPHVFSVTDAGMAWCALAQTGEVLWRERLGGTFSASPVAAGGRLYAVADNGETSVLEAAPAFKVLARNALGENVQASPAIADQKIFIRTEKHLFCLRAQP